MSAIQRGRPLEGEPPERQKQGSERQKADSPKLAQGWECQPHTVIVGFLCAGVYRQLDTVPASMSRNSLEAKTTIKQEVLTV